MANRMISRNFKRCTPKISIYTQPVKTEELPYIETPELVEKHGIVAIGGSFDPDDLLHIYRQGIFPWPESDSVKLWFCPVNRCVILPDNVKISKSLKQELRKNRYQLTVDTAFEQVIGHCSTCNDREKATWITPHLKNSFIELHDRGLAHSFEVREDGKLVGGLYGLGLGSQFSGESMFHLKSNTSKIAFVYLCRVLQALDFSFIDCQSTTEHLLTLGAEEWHKDHYLNEVRLSLLSEDLQGDWTDLKEVKQFVTTDSLI